MPEQGQVVADGRLALAELGAEGADVALALGQDQDDLEPGGVADVLQQDRRPLRLLEPLVGCLAALALLAVPWSRPPAWDWSSLLP